jgi:hypothetical protein
MYDFRLISSKDYSVCYSRKHEVCDDIMDDTSPRTVVVLFKEHVNAQSDKQQVRYGHKNSC